MEVNLSIHNGNHTQCSQENSTKIINDNLTTYEASAIFFAQTFAKITKFLICETELECSPMISEITESAAQASNHAHCVLANVTALAANALKTEQEESTINLINETLPLACAGLTKAKITTADIDAMFSLLMALFNANIPEDETIILKTFQNMIFCLRFFETHI